MGSKTSWVMDNMFFYLDYLFFGLIYRSFRGRCQIQTVRGYLTQLITMILIPVMRLLIGQFFVQSFLLVISSVQYATHSFHQ